MRLQVSLVLNYLPKNKQNTTHNLQEFRTYTATIFLDETLGKNFQKIGHSFVT